MSQRENLPESDQALGAPDPETQDTTLKRGTLGLFGIIFFVVAASAPLAGMTGAVPVAVAIGNGAGAAGMYVVVGLILLLFSVGYATMSHYVTNTGAFFAYVGRGLGIVPGVGSALVSVLAYLTVQWAVLGFISFQMSLQFEAKFGIVLNWWIYALALIVIVYVLSALSVDIGAKFLGVLLVLELLALLTVGFAAIADGGPEGPDFVASFSPSAILEGGLLGGAGIAFAFALASFIGFEATAIYGEESKDPKKTVPRATYISVILITVIFAFVGFGMVTGLGATDISTKVLKTAQAAVYPTDRTDKIPQPLLRKYFQYGTGNSSGLYRVKKELRDLIEFRRLNLIEPFPQQFRFDVIFCRNVMIYFDKATQSVLVNKYYEHLEKGGYLFVGHSESLTGLSHPFKYSEPSIYRK